MAPMPGAFAGDVVEQQHAPDEDEDDSEDDEPAPMLPIRIARGFMNMIWGGGGQEAGEEDSDSEDEGPERNEANDGVD